MTDTTLTTPVIAPEAAAARLRLRGFLVRPHGIKWLVIQDGHPRRLTLSPGDLSLAAQIAQAADDRLSMDQLAEQLYAETGERPPSADVSTGPPGGWGYQTLLIRQIRRDGGTQARIGLHEDTVQEYAELMREHRWDFQTMQRPIVLYDGDAFWLADGFHRIEAAQRAQMADYPVEVLRGTKRDAILRAAGANSQHGLRRTNADKRRAVELLLKDDEWRQWSDRKIADVCAVSDKTVGSIRRELGAEFPHLTSRQGVDGKRYPVAPAAPKRPNAPQGWVWRDNNSLRHIMSGVIIAPKESLEATVLAAEQFNAKREAVAPIASPDHEHQTAVERILKNATTPADYQEAYSHARQASDVTVYNRLMGMVDRAVEGKAVAEEPNSLKAAPAPAPVEPAAPASESAGGYNEKAARDKDRLSTAEANFNIGNVADARALLDQIEVEHWRRDNLRAKITRASALAFHNDQRARLKQFSSAAMISQTTFTQALDHIEALLNSVVLE